jgi:hypothetical protein
MKSVSKWSIYLLDKLHDQKFAVTADPSRNCGLAAISLHHVSLNHADNSLPAASGLALK